MSCPECKNSQYVEGHACIRCGYSSRNKASTSQGPTVADLIADLDEIMREHGAEGISDRVSRVSPGQWALKLLFKYPPREPRPRSGGGHAWPDAEMAKWAFTKFLSLPISDQDEVIAAREDGILYRGDDMDLFRLVCEEQQRREMADKTEFDAKADGQRRALLRPK